METMQPLQMSVMQKMMQRLNAMPDPAAPAAPLREKIVDAQGRIFSKLEKATYIQFF